MNNIKYLFFACLFMCMNTFVNAQNITFNDLIFKELLVDNPEINSNGDDEIQISEAESFSGKLELQGAVISDWTGIEYFTSIKELVCYSLSATDLDVSRNTALERLMCGNLTSLKLGNNEALNYVFTDINHFTSFNVENEHLDTLLCWHNSNPMTIDLSSAAALKFLDLNDNFISSLDVSNLYNLETLNFDVNNVYSIDVSNNKALTHLDCFFNPITEIDISKNTKLQRFRCANTQISSLDLSQNTSLQKLFCDYTQITTLDLSNNENLVWLDCYNSNLTSLNLKNGNNVNFEYVDLRENLNLDCVEVDDVAYSNTNWTKIPDNLTFELDCSTVGLLPDVSSFQYNAYPNPTSDRLFIDLGMTYNDIKIEIFDASLQLKKTYAYTSTSNISLDLEMPAGILIVKMTTESNTESFKIIKE